MRRTHGGVKRDRAGVGRAAAAVVAMTLVLVTVLVAAASPAYARSEESIATFAVRIDVRSDGSIGVTETIEYDFARAHRHGITRRIPTRRHFDRTHDRLYPIDGVSVTMDGSTVQVERASHDGYDVFWIGDPNRTVTGRHAYRIGYVVHGVVRRLADRDEMDWTTIGDRWPVAIGAASVTVAASAITASRCFTGAGSGRRACADATVEQGASVTFREPSLGRNRAMRAVVALPPGSSAGRGPILTTRRTLATAFPVTRGTVGAAVGVAAVGAAVVVALAWLVGHDRRPRERSPNPKVECSPPDGIRPAQACALGTGRAGRRAITATILDLAVRGHLRVRELRGDGRASAETGRHAKAGGSGRRSRGGRPDWELERLAADQLGLLPYERTLLRALFAKYDKVRLSELRSGFAAERARACRQIDEDLIRQGWYRRSPARTRRLAINAAVFALLASVVATVTLAVTTRVALVGIGLVAASLVLLANVGRFSARTGSGAVLWTRVRAYRRFLAAPGDADLPAVAPPDQTFSTNLPYAVAFGLTDRWTRRLRGPWDPGPAAETAWPPSEPGLTWYEGRGPNLGPAPSGTASRLGAFLATVDGAGAGRSGHSGGLPGSGVYAGDGSGYSGGDGGGYSGGDGGGGSW